ncbi:MAG: peptidyl-prolyl cis-trans isomerase [Candidatus Peribacteria bacterium]|nr:peptidyl-prolyl cis-trans isomerase [Candidatus Peribacteria bacterium]
MRSSSISLGIIALATLTACSGNNSATTTDSFNTSSVSNISSDAMSSVPVAMDTSSSSSSAASQKGAVDWDGKILTGKHTVVLKTSQGDITLELNADAAPRTVTNFVTLAKAGYYNGLTFHRVIPGFMIQGGDPNGNGSGGESIYGQKFNDEISNAPDLYTTGYKKGVVAMANAGPNTNGSQFFIMESDYGLSPDYTIFGKVTAGQDTVSKIAAVPRDANDMPGKPVTFTVTVKN